MKKNSKKIILVAGFLALLTLILTILVLQNQRNLVDLTQKADATIILTEQGFEPEKITIHQGDTVLFKTTRNTYFWPASNLHPTHELYAAFDPQEPIEPEAGWSFTFDETGQWQYHDHLAPYYTGTITVTNK